MNDTTMAPTESASHAGGHTPFRIAHNKLDKVSATSSMLSDSSQEASSSAGTGQLCTCSSLVGCSSLQLQEQHLLSGNNSSNACRTAQDMFVLVLSRVNQEPAGTGSEKQKPRQSLGAASDQHSARIWIRQVGNKRLVAPDTSSSTLHHPSRPGSSMSCDRRQLGQDSPTANASMSSISHTLCVTSGTTTLLLALQTFVCPAVLQPKPEAADTGALAAPCGSPAGGAGDSWPGLQAG